MKRELGTDRVLSLELFPQHRSAIEAVWRIDAAMSDVVARANDPMLGRIKLAWWREQLEQLDRSDPPAEPRLRAIAAELPPCGISGADLAEIEPGWATLLDDVIDPKLVADRGARLFTILATIIGRPIDKIDDAGALWALLSVRPLSRPELVEAARTFAGRLEGHIFPMWLRGLSMLASFAAYDLRHGSTAEPRSRSLRTRLALKHIWTGRV